MIRHFLTVALTSLAIAAPASAELFHTGGDTAMIIREDGMAVSIELDHVDHEGDRWMKVGMLNDEGKYQEDGAWVRCQDNLISWEGGEWENIDHRMLTGYIHEVACAS